MECEDSVYTHATEKLGHYVRLVQRAYRNKNARVNAGSLLANQRSLVRQMLEGHSVLVIQCFWRVVTAHKKALSMLPNNFNDPSIHFLTPRVLYL